MRILWVKKKYFDVAPDRTTWIEMVKNLEQLGHRVDMFVGFKEKRPAYNFCHSVTYLPALNNHRLVYHLLFNIELYFRLIFYILKNKPDIVIFDCYTFFNAFPLDLFPKLGILKTKFTMDARSYIYVDGDTSLKNKMKKLLSDWSFAYSKFMFNNITVINVIIFPLLKAPKQSFRTLMSETSKLN